MQTYLLGCNNAALKVGMGLSIVINPLQDLLSYMVMIQIERKD